LLFEQLKQKGEKMKSETSAELKRDFMHTSPLDAAYRAAGSKSALGVVHKPLLFTSQGAKSKVQFDVDAAKNKYRRR
jgi:hypothetical protein